MIWRISSACILYILCLLFLGVNCFSDPYQVLSIHRKATLPEIRKAYKQLAKEWHPDKNKDPAAENRFVEINRAYELLTDPERRRHYDNTGLTEDGPQFRNRQEYRRSEPLDDLFGFQAGGFKFRFKERDVSLFHRLSVTTRAYEGKLMPRSAHTPQLLLFYSDWCFSCLQVEPLWRRIIDELEPIGFQLSTVDAEREPILARKVGVSSLPALALLLDGKSHLLKDPLLSVRQVVDFVRSRFPHKLVRPISDPSDLDAFLAGWSDNRVRAVVSDRRDTVRLRYLVAAFRYRARVAFAAVKSSALGVRHKVDSDSDTLLLFNENTERPVASLSMSDLPAKTMSDVIENNLYLLLPRLSSQELFEALCPRRRRVCVVLVSRDEPSHDPARQILRQHAQDAQHDRVRYSYVFEERQPEFVSALTGGPAPSTLHLVILWRRDEGKVLYEWGRGEWNETLHEQLARVLRQPEALGGEAVVQALIDEHAQGLVTRLLGKLLVAADILRDGVTREQLLPALSVAATLLVVAVAGWAMARLVKLEEEGLAKEGTGPKTAEKADQPQLRLHEMRCETYNGLVRLLKPGCRTVVLLVDSRTRHKLLPAFHRAVWPYRKNKTLMFAHLSLDRGLEWYRNLLTLSLPEPRPLHINPKNCIGTVLALNGHRKYFCMFHAKHPECGGAKRIGRVARHAANEKAGEAAFIGFDSDSSDVEMGDVVFEGNLLDGFPNWLDRLFEGSTQRYYINYWPDFNAK